MKYEITLDDSLDQFVSESAAADAVTAEVWLSRKINGAVKRVLKDSLVEGINLEKPENLVALKTSFDVVKADALAAELLVMSANQPVKPLIP